MAARAEVTAKYAREYLKASKSRKGRVLDEVCAVTGWSRDNARRRLVQAGKPLARGAPKKKQRRVRTARYGYDTRKVLQQVWAASSGQCGKYLRVAMPDLLVALETHGELVLDQDRYSDVVREELLSMSAATIDRYLKPIKDARKLKGASATKPGPLLRSSIKVRKAGDEMEQKPGFFEIDTVAHCGPTLKGEFARSLNMTDVFTGWTFTTSIRNNSSRHIIAGLNRAINALPIPMEGADFDNGSEFINYDVVEWAQNLELYFTRSRPYKKNDQATIESKNNHVVRKYAYYWRYDTPAQLSLLGRLWVNVNDLMNYHTPTIKPIGWTTDSKGRRKRVYDKPRTPFQRLIDAGVLTGDQVKEMTGYKQGLNPAQLSRNIHAIGNELTALAKGKTVRHVRDVKIRTELTNVEQGIKQAS